MNNEEKILSMLEALTNDVSGLKADMAELKEDVAELKEDMTVVKGAVEYIVDWADAVGKMVQVPFTAYAA